MSREFSSASRKGSNSQRLGLVDPTMSAKGSGGNVLFSGFDADNDDMLDDVDVLFAEQEEEEDDEFGDGAGGKGSDNEEDGPGDLMFDEEKALKTSKVKRKTLFGGLLSWGRPDNQRLGNTDDFAFRNSRHVRIDRNSGPGPQAAPLSISGIPEKAIRQVACADKVTAVLLANGQVWMWGNGIARPAREERLTMPVVQLSAGAAHFAAVTDERTRNLFTWGANASGQLGHGDTARQDRPKRVMGIGSNSVVHVTCGAQFTMAVTSRGRLYAWGDNSYGQLGLGIQKEEVVYNRRVTKWVPDTRSRSKPTLVESLVLPPYSAFDLVRNKRTYRHLMIATGQEHAVAWLTDPSTGEVADLVTGSMRQGQDVVMRQQQEVKRLRAELAEVRARLERFHMSTDGGGGGGGEERAATTDGAVERFLSDDATMKGTGQLVEAAHIKRADAERALNAAKDDLVLVNRQVGSLSEELSLVAKNSKALWTRIEAINEVLSGETREEVVGRLRQELEDKMELARASDLSYEEGMRRRHEREVEKHSLERIVAESLTDMEAADHQIRTLAQLKADRKARLRTEYTRMEHSDVEALSSFSRRVLESLRGAEVRTMAMNGETLEAMRRQLARAPGLDDLLSLSESRITEIGLRLEHEIGEGLDDEDAVKGLADAMLALLKDNVELRKHVNFLVRGVMEQTQQRLSKQTAEAAVDMARGGGAHTTLAGSATPATVGEEVHLQGQQDMAARAASARTGRPRGGLLGRGLM